MEKYSRWSTIGYLIPSNFFKIESLTSLIIITNSVNLLVNFKYISLFRERIFLNLTWIWTCELIESSKLNFNFPKMSIEWIKVRFVQNITLVFYPDFSSFIFFSFNHVNDSFTSGHQNIEVPSSTSANFRIAVWEGGEFSSIEVKWESW